MPNRWFTSVRNEIRFNRILNWRGNKILVQPLLYKKWQKKKRASALLLFQRENNLMFKLACLLC
jgi:hypothetical protein